MKILSHDQSLFYHLPALSRGHVIFTSLIQLNGKLLFLDAHIDRLLQGADFLFPHIRWDVQKELIMKSACDEVKNEKDAYLRITLCEDVLWFQKKSLLETPHNLKLQIAKEIKSPGLKPTFLKISNYFNADLELRVAHAKEYDDILYFDNQNLATEASSSNIFLVTKEGRIKTPPLSSNVLSGIIRGKLLEFLTYKGFEVREESFGVQELLMAREIWLTNAVKGVRIVSQFQERSFDHSPEIYNNVITHFGRYGEKYE